MAKRRKPTGILVDPAALKAVAALPCDICGRAWTPRSAHHIVKRGMGGGRRFDHPANLLSVCEVPTMFGEQTCHQLADSLPKRAQFLFVDKRSGNKGGIAEAFVLRATRDKVRREQDTEG